MRGNTAEGLTSSATFDELAGLGGALRMFVAVLWLEDVAFESNTARTIGGAMFVNQSCLPMSTVFSLLPNQLHTCCIRYHVPTSWKLLHSF